MMSDRAESQGRPGRREPGRAGRRKQSRHLRPALARLEERTLLSGVQAIDLGDAYTANGQSISLLRATDQVVLGVAPGGDASALAARLTATGGPLEGFTTATTGDGKVVVATAGTPLPGTAAQQLDQLDHLIAQVKTDAGVAFAAEGFVVPGDPSASGRLWATRDVVVQLAPGVTPEQAFSTNEFSAYQRLSGSPDQYVATTTATAGAGTLAISDGLAHDPRFVWASPDFYRTFAPAGLNDPLLSGEWNMTSAHVTQAWDRGYDGSGVVIASLDTGVELGHPDLNYWTNPGEIPGDGLDNDGNGWADDVHGWDFVNNDATLEVINNQAHGTQVAGIAAASGDNGIGVAGAAYRAQVMILPVITTATESQLASAIYYAAGRTADGLGTWKSADVANNSWVLNGDSPVIATAFDWAAAFGRQGKGLVSIAASGNSGTGVVSSPASLASTIAVGASTILDTRATYSQFGGALDLVAPSGGSGSPSLPTTTTGGGYTSVGSGTSYAAPLVSGVAALLLQANPNLTFDEVRAILRGTADKIGGVVYNPGGFNPQFGFGRVNADAALNEVLTTVSMDLTNPLVINEAQTYDGLTIGTFSFYRPLSPPSLINTYTATINPGNGGPALPAQIVDNGDNTYAIVANGLRYNIGGTYTLSVTLEQGGQTEALASTTVKAVHEVTASLVPFSPTEGTNPLFSGVVARFETATPATASEFTALIDWGNGVQSPGLISTDPQTGNGFVITGSNAYLHEGVYPFSVTLSNLNAPLDTGTALVGEVTVKDAAIVGSPVSLTRAEGVAFSGVIATFIDTNTFGRLSDYAATIDWGDGSPIEPGAISAASATVWNVKATHTYRDFGTYSVTVHITGGSTSTTDPISTVKVPDAKITVTPSATVNLDEGQEIQPDAPWATLATFVDANPLGLAGDFVATVSWGDGSPVEAGSVNRRADGVFEVHATGSHHYTKFGTYTVVVTINASKPGGVSASTTFEVRVADAALAPTDPQDAPGPIHPAEGLAFTGVVAAFRDTNPYATRPQGGWGDGQATINWGDGSPSQPGQVQYDPARDIYLVTGVNKVYQVGTWEITVNVQGDGGSQTEVHNQAIVANADLTSLVANDLGSISEGTLFNGVIATFVDGNPTSLASNFSATVSWGDTVVAGQVLTNNTGGFNVVAPRTFTIGTYDNIRVTITDKGAPVGSANKVTTTASPGHLVVTDAPIANAKGAGTVQAAEGFPFSSTLATFIDTNPQGVPGNFTATVDWGDGSVSSGPDVSVGRVLGGAFGVQASHTFGVGTHTATITITSLDDPTNTATVTTDVAVANAPLAIQGRNQQLAQGQSVSGVLATLSDGNPSQAANQYDVTIQWGDGSPTAPGRLVTRGGGQFNVEALVPHLYARVGSFPIVVTVSDGQGGRVESSSTAEVANAPLTATFTNLSPTAKVGFSGEVARFRDGNALATPGSHSARINWGDGSVSDGRVEPSGDGGYRVLGDHTYGQSGPRDVTVVISDGEGGSTSAFGTVQVAARITPVTGWLNPLDDHGPSAQDGVTNVSTPRFVGTAGSGDQVTLYAARADLPYPLVIGTGRAGDDGSWSIASVPLSDGVYTIFAGAADEAGHATSKVEVVRSSPGGQLVIDTQGPRVTGSSLDPRAGRFLLTIQDNLVGLDQAGLANPTHYGLAQNGRRGASPIPIVGLSVTPGAYGAPQTVALETGRRLGSGGYVVSISGAGVTDLAGNPLEGGFFAPTTPTRPGTAFVAQLTTDGNTASGPVLPSVAARYFPRSNLARRFQRRGV